VDWNEDDKSAEFVKLITQHQRTLFGYIVTLVRNSSDSEDILQETNLVLWNKHKEYKSGTDFMAWASCVAFFKSQNFLKTKSRNRVCFNDQLLTKLSDMQIDRADVHTINSTMLVYCLEKLSATSQQLLKLCYGGNQSIQEVARQLGRPVGSIYNTLSHIRLKLWKCIHYSIKEEDSL
jgi:RNA polymerase sigma-70 factor, ECF subfamily